MHSHLYCVYDVYSLQTLFVRALSSVHFGAAAPPHADVRAGADPLFALVVCSYEFLLHKHARTIQKEHGIRMLFILLTIVLVVLSAFCHMQTKDQEINVPKRGLEPPRGCPHYDLNVARLPIPPLRLAVLCNIFHSIHHHPAPARTAPPLRMYVLYSVF